MAALERRIEALELVNPMTESEVYVCQYVSPGRLDEEIAVIEDNNGNRWDRLPGELESGLLERAKTDVKRAANGCAVLYGHGAQA